MSGDLAATVAHKTHVRIFAFGLIDDAEMLESRPKIRTSHTKLGYQSSTLIILVN